MSFESKIYASNRPQLTTTVSFNVPASNLDKIMQNYCDKNEKTFKQIKNDKFILQKTSNQFKKSQKQNNKSKSGAIILWMFVKNTNRMHAYLTCVVRYYCSAVDYLCALPMQTSWQCPHRHFHTFLWNRSRVIPGISVGRDSLLLGYIEEKKSQRNLWINLNLVRFQ